MSHKKQNRIIIDLVKGKEYANQLKELLLLKPFGDEELVLAQELAQKVLKSFTNPLAEISSCGSGEKKTCSAEVKFQDSVGEKPEVNKRVGYKKRRVVNSQVVVSATAEDGYAWRKYGQKQILDSKHPRCYFRCTHKSDQSCLAIKQVQKIDLEDSIMFKTTYFGHHTCKDTTKLSQIIISDSDPMDSKLISFQREIKYDPTSNADSLVNQEPKEETQSDLTDSKSSINPNVWQDLVVSPRMGSSHEEVVSSVYTSATTTSLHDFDMKIFSRFADFNDHDFHFHEN